MEKGRFSFSTSEVFSESPSFFVTSLLYHSFPALSVPALNTCHTSIPVLAFAHLLRAPTQNSHEQYEVDLLIPS
jgi:hypothetical protein